MTRACGMPAAPANERGLCTRCYTTAKRLIESGKTTWEQLENAGFVLHRRDPFEEQLRALENTTVVDPNTGAGNAASE